MQTLDRALKDLQLVLAKRPVALLFAEDDVGLNETIEHYVGLGFDRVVVFAEPSIARPMSKSPTVRFVDYDCAPPESWVNL